MDVNESIIPTSITHLPTFQQDRWMNRRSLLQRMPDTMENGWLLHGSLFAKHFRAGGYLGDEASADKVRAYMEELELDLPMTRAWWHSFVTDRGTRSSWIQGSTTDNWGMVTVPSRSTANVRVFLCHATMDPDSGWYHFKTNKGEWENAICIAECSDLDEAESLVWGQESYLSAARSIDYIEQSSAERAERKDLLKRELDDALDF